MCQDKEKLKIIRNWTFGFDMLPQPDGYVGIMWVTKKHTWQVCSANKGECLDVAYKRISDHLWMRIS